LENDRIAARIRQGLADADAGRVTPAREALEQLRQKHNIPRL
jgi:predicted transcriptional regulator